MSIYTTKVVLTPDEIVLAVCSKYKCENPEFIGTYNIYVDEISGEYKIHMYSTKHKVRMSITLSPEFEYIRSSAYIPEFLREKGVDIIAAKARYEARIRQFAEVIFPKLARKLRAA